MATNGYDQFFKVKREKSSGVSPVTSGKKSRVSRAHFKRPIHTPLKQNDKLEWQLRQAFGIQKKKTKKTKIPWSAFLSLGLASGLMVWLTFSPISLEGIIDKVEVRMFGQATAQANISPPQGLDAEKNVTQEDDRSVASVPEQKSWSAEDLNHFKKLNERKKQLDQREQELSQLEEELHKQKVEIDQRIQQLQEIRDQIAGTLQERVEIDQERINTLVEFYSSMRPQQAAGIMASINEDLAIEVLSRMKRQNAAEIMNLMDPEKAQVLTEKFAGYKR